VLLFSQQQLKIDQMARKLLSVTVLALLVAAAFAQGSSTQVSAPAGTKVDTKSTPQGSQTKVDVPAGGTKVQTQTGPQGTNTKVTAPGTQVTQTPAGAAVKAPGTTAVGNSQATNVQAPGTTVKTNNQNGATQVRTPGANVDVAPNGATRVVVPGIGTFGSRKMLRA